jgi:hypothetical protein
VAYCVVSGQQRLSAPYPTGCGNATKLLVREIIHVDFLRGLRIAVVTNPRHPHIIDPYYIASGWVEKNDIRTRAGFRYAFSCANASLASATYATSRLSAMTTCRYNDNGPQLVRARIIDQNGGFTEYTTEVIVNNVAPTATLSNNGPIDEGGSATISFSSPFDPSTADVAAGFHYAFSCTNASLDAATYVTGSATPSTSCPFANDGVHTVRGRIIDKDGGATDYTTAVTVRDITPVMTAAQAQSGNEGASVAFNLGTLADPSNDGPWVISIAWGDSYIESFSTNATGTLTRNHTYGDNGAYTVSVSALDANHVSSNNVTLTATIANIAPQVGALQFEDESGTPTVDTFLALSGLPVDLEAPFTDVGTLDTHVSSVNWGDGTSGAGTVTESGGTGTASASHTWSNPGIFTVNVTVTDDDSGVGTRQGTIAVTDAKGAVCAIGGLLTSMLNDPTLDRATVSALTELVGKTYGNVDGQAANGACDMFAVGNDVAAVVKLEQAVQIIEALVARGGLTPSRLAVFRQVEARLVLVGKWTYVMLARTVTDSQKLAAAALLAQAADAATASHNYIIAVRNWLAAVRLLVPTT